MMFQQELAALTENDAWSHCWPDEDEDVVPSEQALPTFAPCLKLTPGLALPCGCSLMIGMVGDGAEYLAQLKPKSMIGTLHLPEVLLGNIKVNLDLPSSLCTIYQTQNIVLVLCGYKIIAQRAHSWVSLLLQTFKPTNVIILDTLPRKVQGAPSLYLIESDAQKRWREETGLSQPGPYLDSSILVEGATAAALTLCQLHKVRACALVLSARTENEGSLFGASLARLADSPSPDREWPKTSHPRPQETGLVNQLFL